MSNQKTKQIVTRIFSETGVKVEEDDPMVILMAQWDRQHKESVAALADANRKYIDSIIELLKDRLPRKRLNVLLYITLLNTLLLLFVIFVKG